MRLSCWVFYISIETDRECAGIVSRAWKDVVAFRSVEEVTGTKLKTIFDKYPRLRKGLIVGGPPCQPFSGLSRLREGFVDSRSLGISLFGDLLRAAEVAAPHIQFHSLMENVASMMDTDRAAISHELQQSHLWFDAAEVGHVRRPRLYWTSWDSDPKPTKSVTSNQLEYCKNEREYVRVRVREAAIPPLSAFLDDSPSVYELWARVGLGEELSVLAPDGELRKRGCAAASIPIFDPGEHRSDEDERVTVLTQLDDQSIDSGLGDSVPHLVQDEDTIAELHECALPLDEYYDELVKLWWQWWPETDPKLMEHMISVCIAFDTATAFAMSFGIAKFSLAQVEAKLVGEIVGRHGRSPNPAIVRAIKKWPPVYTLKQLQEFLGTINYVRPHCGPEYARIADAIRLLLKPGATFPPNEKQIASIDALKELVVEHHKLCVPDEATAIEAANAWLSGAPPARRPYEIGADTSRYAIGGVCGQCDRDNGTLLALLYETAHLAKLA